LEKYRFSKYFREIIGDICHNTLCNVILLYRLSKDINIIRGVRQGDPLSMVLFLMILEPLILLLEKSGKGYDMNDGNAYIPASAYEDGTERKFTF
jgi:hypothetical protein